MLAPTVMGGAIGRYRPPAPARLATGRPSQLDRIRTTTGPLMQAYLDLIPTPAQAIKKPVGDEWGWVVNPKTGEPLLLGEESIERALASWFGSAPYHIGLRFTAHTRHGIIDLDAGSRHHTAKTLRAIDKAAEGLGLKLTPCQSSHSGGWHLYVTSTEFISSESMGRLLKGLVARAGIRQLAAGQCEVYPDSANPTQGVRLPGQDGFGILDPYTGEAAQVFDGADPAHNLGRVLWLFTDRANTRQAIAKALEVLGRVEETPAAKNLPGRPIKKTKAAGTRGSGKIWDAPRSDLVMRHDRNAIKAGTQAFHDHANPHGIQLFNEGRRYYRQGLTQMGTRYQATKAVNFYLLFVGFTNPSERAAELTRWINAKHNGHSEAINKGRTLKIEAEHARLVSSGRKTTPADPSPKVVDFFQVANRRRKCQARLKLEQALADLVAAGERPTQRAIRTKTGLAYNTITKHLREMEAERTNRVESGEIHRDQPQAIPPVISPIAEPQTETSTHSEVDAASLEGWPEGYAEAALGLVDHLALRDPAYADYHSEVVVTLMLEGRASALHLAAVNVQHVYQAFRQGLTTQEAAIGVRTSYQEPAQAPTFRRQNTDNTKGQEPISEKVAG